MREIRRFLLTIPENKQLVFLLFLINLLGAFYGFYWYRNQIAETPWYSFVVVVDSPLSSLLFAIFLWFVLKGTRVYWLEGLAQFTMIKYGLWAVAVLWLDIYLTGRITFEATHLTISHLGMALEAIIFMRYYTPKLWSAGLALVWLVLNDIVDYTFDLHPYLPWSVAESWAAFFAVTFTVLACIVYLVVRRGGKAVAKGTS